MLNKFPAMAAAKTSRWYRLSLWATALFLVYLLFGFLVLPWIVKSQLLKRLPGITKRQAAIREVRFNPLALSLTIRGLALTEPDGQVFASWEELYINFQLSSLFRLAWTFDEIGLKRPYGRLILFKDGRFNFANIGQEAGPPQRSEPGKAGGMPRVIVWRLHIDNGLVAWDDQTHRLPMHVEIRPIELSLTNFTTRPGKSGLYGFEAASDTGKRLAWSGTLVMQPFQSRGHIELTGIEAGKWTPLLRDYLRAEITQGRVDVRADYDMEAGTNGFRLNARNGAVGLTELEVKDLNTGEVVTQAPRLSITAIDFDLRGRKLHAGALKLDGYTKTVRIEKDGSLNLNLLVEPSTSVAATNRTAAAAPKEAALPWIFAVDDFRFSNGAISFTDLSRRDRFETTLKPIEIHVQGFSTAPDSNAAFDFRIPSEAGEAVSGGGTCCVAPLRAAGQLKLAALEIRRYAPYYQDLLRGEVVAGKLGAGLDYRFAMVSNTPLVTISNAALTLADLQLKEAESGETVVAIPSFAVERTEASLATREVTIGQVKSSGGSIVVRQMKDGSVNLARLLNQTRPGGGETPRPQAEGLPWTALVKEIAFDNYAIKLEDQKPAKAAVLAIDQLGFTIKDVSTRSNQEITASLSARLNEEGRVQLAGSGKIAPPMTDMEVTVSGVDLRPFQPYVNEAVRLAIDRGRFNTRSRIRYATPGSGEPRLKIAGEIGLTNFLSTDQAQFKEFVKWDSLKISGIDFELEPNQLRLHEVEWHGLRTSVIIGPDHRLNLTTILPEKTARVDAAASPAPNPASPSAGFPLQLDRLVLDNASFHFSDDSIEPNCAFDILELSGAVTDLSSRDQTTALVGLRGKVDATAPFYISGKVNPLARELALDLAVGFTNTDLTAFSTYLERYAGHPLTKGKLSMDLHYDIDTRRLKAENKFRLDHFTLGPRNDSTNATHLPVKLAVALLKDRDGRIDLDIPVSGRTDDPQFRIGPIVLKAVVNIMVKAATAPFSLLGALVGGGEELSYVDFPAGGADLPAAGSEKLEKLARALEERPALNLEIAGSFDPERDRAGLARLKLEQRLRLLRMKELGDAGGATPSLEGLQLDPPLRERLLKKLLADLGTNQTLVLQAAGTAETSTLSGLTNTPAGQGKSDRAPQDSPRRHGRHFSADDSKGAAGLSPVNERAGSKRPKPVAKPQLAAGATVAPLSPEEIEARLISAIQISEDERRDLIKRRAAAVETAILKTGRIAGDRLFIAAPKTTQQIPKGETRANLLLN